MPNPYQVNSSNPVVPRMMPNGEAVYDIPLQQGAQAGGNHPGIRLVGTISGNRFTPTVLQLLTPDGGVINSVPVRRGTRVGVGQNNALDLQDNFITQRVLGNAGIQRALTGTANFGGYTLESQSGNQGHQLLPENGSATLRRVPITLRRGNQVLQAAIFGREGNNSFTPQYMRILNPQNGQFVGNRINLGNSLTGLGQNGRFVITPRLEYSINQTLNSGLIPGHLQTLERSHGRAHTATPPVRQSMRESDGEEQEERTATLASLIPQDAIAGFQSGGVTLTSGNMGNLAAMPIAVGQQPGNTVRL